MLSRSSTTTDNPWRASSVAATRPLWPPPTTTTSARGGSASSMARRYRRQKAPSEGIAPPQPRRPAVRVVDHAVHRRRPDAGDRADRLHLVHPDPGAGLVYAFVPEPQCVSRVDQPLVVRGDAEMFGPQQRAQLSRQPPVVVHHRAGELRVVRPRPTVEVVGAARHPGVVDDADLRVDIHRYAAWVVQVEDTEAAATGFAQ